MTEKQWFRMKQPESLAGFVLGRCSARKFRLFGCACCWRLGELLTDERSRAAIEVSERFADELATKKELVNAKSRAARVANTLPIEETYRGTPSTIYLACLAAEFVTSPALTTVLAAADKVVRAFTTIRRRLWKVERAIQADIFRDIFGNPFRPAVLDAAWRTDTAVSLARTMYDSRDFGAMPILADALQDAGCDNEHILNHCRHTSLAHVRGCWVVDLVLGKE
jgi:hypothetical protein